MRSTSLPPTTAWFKASRSNSGSQCVEVAFSDDLVFIRDSKYLRNASNDPDVQPIITVAQADWPAFLRTVTDGTTSIARPAVHQQAGGGATLRDGCGTELSFTLAEWEAFTAGVLNAEFDLPQVAAA